MWGVWGKKGQVAQSLSLGVWERVVLCSKEGLRLWRGRKELWLDSGFFRENHRSGGHVNDFRSANGSNPQGERRKGKEDNVGTAWCSIKDCPLPGHSFIFN